MTREARPTAAGNARRTPFLIAIGLASAFLLLALLPAYALVFTNWLPTDAWLALRPDRSPGDEVHRLHSLALGLIAWSMLSGVVLQFHRPRRKLGALLMSLTAVAGVAGGEAITGSFTIAGVAPFLVLVLVPCALHPSAPAIIRPWRVNLPMLAMTLLAAPAWIAYGLRVAGSALPAGPGGEVEHMTFVVTVALLVPLWALVGTTDKPGWTFPAGAAVVAGACVALQSLMFPDALSGLEPAWAAAAMVWCVAYGVAAGLRSREARTTGSFSSDV